MEGSVKKCRVEIEPFYEEKSLGEKRNLVISLWRDQILTFCSLPIWQVYDIPARWLRFCLCSFVSQETAILSLLSYQDFCLLFVHLS